MKHHLKRQLRRLATERPYQVVVAAAATLVAASTTGVLIAGPAQAPARQETAAVAEVAPRLDEAASRDQARVAAAAPVSPSASPSATATPDPDLTTSAPKPAATKQAVAKKAVAKKVVAEKPAAKKPPASKVLDYTYEAQTTYYNCGPAAVRNALSASGVETTQDGLAGPLGTTEMGTNSAEDTTRVLNQMVKGSPYRTTMFAGSPSSAQIERLSADVVEAVSSGRGVVANIAGDATDTQGGWHSFPGGHYIAVVGYQDNGRTLRIADSADPSLPAYWISAADLANWIATRGYSA
ncbi:C39 family peptidase [Micromonospora siamensis]|uniref:Peptidase_C39 like family protein n=1 Tax=Micromonospora siamensis TaxID=299152 RepID=A0A1C5HYQ9_9ACTN|nr:C39 family peptidase [Micromonospora siamensis]SCG51156.1 Peptidase_C39 like family protein [Micromonospora siamensis]